MTELFPTPPQVDILTHDLCVRHGLVLPEDLAAGVYKLRDGGYWIDDKRCLRSYILTAEELPQKHWRFGIPVLEVTLTSDKGPQILIGRMDVCKVQWCVDPDWPPGQATWTGVRYDMAAARRIPNRDIPKVYHQGQPIRPGLGRVRPKTRGWQQWAFYLANQIEMHRPDWDDYLKWEADRRRAAAKAEEAARSAAAIEAMEEDEGLTGFTG